MLILYTAVGYAISDINCSGISIVNTPIGYTGDDINLECTTVGKIMP